MNWRDPPPLSAAEAVALTRAELDVLGPGSAPTVMWWPRVTVPALVLGRTATPAAAIEQAATRRGLKVARRPSGGGPVLWDGELLAFDVLLPRGHRLAVDDVVAGYRWLGELVVDALRSLGLDARRVEVEEARRRQILLIDDPTAALCFGGISPHEVIVGEQKVLGLCQARRAGGVLLQAGLPLALDVALLAELAGAPEATDSLAARIGVVPAEARLAIATRL